MEKVFEIVRLRQEVVEKEIETDTIRSPQDAIELLKKEIGDEDREVFYVICLNTKNKIVGLHRCHIGSLNSSIVHPREVFKSAILNNASSIIVGHNHPSYQTKESKEDIEVTRRLVEAGKIIGIQVLDHIIVSPTGSNSLKELGYI